LGGGPRSALPGRGAYKGISEKGKRKETAQERKPKTTITWEDSLKENGGRRSKGAVWELILKGMLDSFLKEGWSTRDLVPRGAGRCRKDTGLKRGKKGKNCGVFEAVFRRGAD